jgi:hypothetical protein
MFTFFFWISTIHNLTYFTFVKFANKVILFQETFHFEKVILLCYNMQNIVRMITQIPTALAWHIYQIIVDTFGIVIFACILN